MCESSDDDGAMEESSHSTVQSVGMAVMNATLNASTGDLHTIAGHEV